MDHLWSPWRFRYVASLGNEKGCPLCRLQSDEDDKRTLVLFKGQYSFLVLNKYPYCTGHLMVVTYRHVATLGQASSEELVEIVQLAADSERALQAVYKPDGFNVGFNIGRAAGAGVDGHIHLHVVPRWEGDTNFTSVLGETRVLPEDLKMTYSKLRFHFCPK